MDAKADESGLVFDVIASVRNRIADELLVVGSILGIFGLFTSLATILSVGSQFEHVGIGVAFLVYVGTALFRKHLSYEFRAAVIIGVCFALGVLNYWGWGLIGAGGIWFLATIIYAMVFLNASIGKMVFGLVIFCNLLLTLAVSLAWLPQRLDFVTYANSVSSWVARLVLTVIVGWMFYNVLQRILILAEAQVQTAKNRTQALDKQAVALQEEVLHRAEAEARLEKLLERLQIIDKSKSHFISQISHELRTPISNVKLYQELLLRRPEKSETYLPIIQEELGRLSSIVDKMVMTSEMQAEIDNGTHGRVNLVNVIHWVISNYQGLATNRGIVIRFEKPEKDMIVWGSLPQIQQAFSTLVDNAIKYNHGTQIEIETCSSDGKHGIAIRNPSGSSEENISIFEPFMRGNSAMTFHVAGAGLGLSNARRIVEHYSGSIEMKALRLGEEDWLEFCLWLPISNERV
jgi:signal transduction histidine kinase